ncbi:MAG TPA: isocitrate dehydrogenase, partial [Rhodobacteraceae bacterium]|nr:isocitrate dehydrogenase [Paracoccaceae bacterium]
HLLEAEFFHALFIRRDGGTFDGHTDFFGFISRIDGDLVIG